MQKAGIGHIENEGPMLLIQPYGVRDRDFGLKENYNVIHWGNSVLHVGSQEGIVKS